MAIQDFKVKNGLSAAGNALISGGTLSIGATAVAPIVRAIDTTLAVSLFDTSSSTITLGNTSSTVAVQSITSATSQIRGTTAATAVSLFDTSTSTITIGTTGSTIAVQSITSGTAQIRAVSASTTVNAFDTSTGTINLGGAGSTVYVKNLNVAGTTTTVNSASLDVSTNYINLNNFTPLTGITGTAAGTNTITVSSASGMTIGQTVVVTAGTPTLPGGTTITNISSNTLTLSNAFTGSGAVTLTISGSVDATADGGGIILKGTTNKTIIWDLVNTNWTSNQHFNLAAGKKYKINNVQISAADLSEGKTNTGKLVTTSTLWSVKFMLMGA